MLKITTWMALVCLIPCTLLAQGTNIEFVEYEMENGLHVILHEDHATPIVAVSVMYHVGSKNEQPDRTGFAHFFEHLLFEGSKHVKRGEFDKLLTNAGGMNNANTNFDRTFYYEVLPSNHLELALWLESERLMHAKIDQEGVDTQREVVKEERRERIDNRPYGSILEETFSHAFTKHPYRWTAIGSMDHLNSASLEEFVEFYKTFYVPNNAVLSIAGDIDIKETKKLIDRYFSDIPRGAREIYRPNIVEPKKTAEVRDIVYDNIQLPGVIIAYHTPKQGTPDAYAMTMLGALLSQGESSRLNKSVKDKQQKALATGAFPVLMEDPGLVIMYGIANAGVSADQLEASIIAEVEDIRQNLISEDEFQKLRNQIESDFISRNSRVVGIAESLANYHMYFGDANLINTEIERYLKVTREDLKKVADTYLSKENRVVLHYLPKSQQPQEGTN